MQVLITGALGWLGRGLTETVSRAHRVRALDLERIEWLREDLRFRRRDGVRRRDRLRYRVREAVEGQEAIIHAAVSDTVRRNLYRPGDPVPFDVNLRGTYNVLEAGRLAGVRRFVLIAAAETHVEHAPGTFVDRNRPYAGTGSIYDLTKRLQESIAEWFSHHHGLEIIVLRLGDVVDLDLARTKRDAANWKASMERDGWLHRYDVGEACLRALEIPHHGYDVFHLVGAPGGQEEVRRGARGSGARPLVHFRTRGRLERARPSGGRRRPGAGGVTMADSCTTGSRVRLCRWNPASGGNDALGARPMRCRPCSLLPSFPW